MSTGPTKLDYIELADFRYRLRTFMRFSEMAAQSVGITPTQHQLMLCIAGFPSRHWMTPTELAVLLQIRHHSCLGLIQRMERIQLVTRFPHPEDGRSVCVTLTEKGQRLLETLTIRHQAELKRLGMRYQDFLDEIEGEPKDTAIDP